MLGILANGPTWEICPQKKKKKPGNNQCGEKGGGGGVLHTLRICGFEQFRITDWSLTDRLTSERWSKLYRGRLSGPVLPYKICLSVRPSRFPNPTVRAESRFPNPTVWAGFAGELKRGTVASDGRTDALSEFIYKIHKDGNPSTISTRHVKSKYKHRRENPKQSQCSRRLIANWACSAINQLVTELH
jgi:hypothetical protein